MCGLVSTYEKQRQLKQEEIKKHNNEIIKNKYEFIIKDNNKCSKAMRE